VQVRQATVPADAITRNVSSQLVAASRNLLRPGKECTPQASNDRNIAASSEIRASRQGDEVELGPRRRLEERRRCTRQAAEGKDMGGGVLGGEGRKERW
jgi:hypothetical protein